VAVDNLSLEVKKGSVTFLLGPNGGGKTTILKCIAGMTKVDPGTVLQLNEDGLVFGICPQMNVGYHWPLHISRRIDADYYRPIGIILPSRSTSKSGGNSKQLPLITTILIMTTL